MIYFLWQHSSFCQHFSDWFIASVICI